MKTKGRTSRAVCFVLLIGLSAALAGCSRSSKRTPNAKVDSKAAKLSKSATDLTAPRIIITPNPPGRGPGPHLVTVFWTTGGDDDGEVYVSANDASEELFAQGPSGSKEANWIHGGVAYQFRLYAGRDHKTELSNVRIK